jgi:hypothetical protein
MGGQAWFTRFLLGLTALAALIAVTMLWQRGAPSAPDVSSAHRSSASPDALSGGASDALGGDALAAPADQDPDPDPSAEPASLLGMVVNGETEEPLSGASVEVRHRGGVWRGETDAEGRFFADALRPGPLVVEARLTGWSGGGPQAQPLTLDAAPGARLTDAQALLFEDGALEGQLILGDQPGSATITLHYVFDASGSIDLTLPPTTTAPDGRFVLEGLPPGQIEVEASDGRYVLADPPEVLISGGSRTDLGTLTLVFGGALRGEVRDAVSGRPIPQAAVALVDGDKTRFRRLGARADALGRFTLAGVVGTHGVLEVSATGYAPARQEVEVEQGQRLDLRPISLTPLMGLTVTVISSDGAPVEGAVVSVLIDPQGAPLWTATTGGEGIALLEDVEGGPYLVRALHSSAGASRDTLAAGGSTVTLTLGPPSALVGHVRSSDGSTPQQVTVAVSRAGGGPVARQTLADEAGGYFSFAALTQGSYTVEAAAPGFARARVTPVEVTAGRETRISVTLTAGGTITGTVRDANTGAPIAGARLQMGNTRQALGGPLTATTDDDGRFRVEGVDPERKTVEASAPGYMRRYVSGVLATPGRALTLDIALTPLSDPTTPGGTQLVGIGATLNRDGEGVIIQRVIDGSAAASLGLRPGDRILSVDGEPVGGLDLNDVVERIRGDEGTPVRLTIQRDGGPPQDMTTTRKPVTIE